MLKPLLQQLPFIGRYLVDDTLLDRESIIELEKRREIYRNVIGVGSNETFASAAFNTFNASRTSKSINALEKSKSSNDISLVDIINDKNDNPENSLAAKAARNFILTGLTPQPAYDQAMTAYEENTVHFKELIKKIPGNGFGVEDVLSVMKGDVDAATAAIKQQQALDKQALEDAFAMEGFQNALMNAYNIVGDPDAPNKIAALKDSMLVDLEASQKEQLDQFNKETSDCLNTLHQAASNQLRDKGFLDFLANADEENRKRIEEMSRQKKEAMGMVDPAVSSIEFELSDDKVEVSHAELVDLDKFKTLTGMEVTQVEKGKFVIKLDPFYNLFYYQSLKQKPVADATLMAMAVRAEGYDTITWTASIDEPDKKNPTVALERLRQCVEGSVRAGFPLDKIKVKDPSTGKEMNLQELFKDDKYAYNDLQERSTKIQKQLAQINSKEPEPTTPMQADKIKAEVRTLVEEARAKAEEEARAAADPAAGGEAPLDPADPHSAAPAA